MGILQMPGFISNYNARENIANTTMASSSATTSKRANSHIPPPSNLAHAGEDFMGDYETRRGVNSKVILATLGEQCASTWRWIRSWALKLDGDEGSNAGDEESIKQPSIRISHSLPDLNLDPNQPQHNCQPEVVKDGKKVLRQITMPSVPTRHQTFQRQLSHRLEFDGIEFKVCKVKPRNQTSIGEFKPELYSKELQKQPSIESNENAENMQYCGKLSFTLRYDFELDALIIKVLEAHDLPVKDMTGSSDPYVKVFLLPDRKKKFQTKVHRKNLDPVFNETFIVSVNYDDLLKRHLQFSVYDFDRFSRHDLIGQVVLKNLLDGNDLRDEIEHTMNILCPPQDKLHLGEIMLSLCYLPTAGRLTITIVKARHLKAMDLTGSSDPYVKVYLICGNKRMRKKRTSVKRSTLNPIYNEALTFDVPSSNIEEVSLIVKVIDYDRIGYDELMGCVGIGTSYIGTGRDHWLDMLDNPRKPVAQWYTLMDSIPGPTPSPNTSSIRFNCLTRRK
ncbi:synaptotagmin-10-like [Planococcus citri]|uniref:synaptotagmin-10-like n=1 Tax=Planococcus citri TaxID=170843 RepID=UPI0031F8B6DD